MRLALIGGGVMGEAILKRTLQRRLATKAEVSVGEPVLSRREALSSRLGVATMADNLQAVQGKEIIVLAVKPQDLAKATASLRGRLQEGQLALSIVAGTPIETLARLLEHKAIVRVMPNTPAQVGAGMSVWTATKEVSQKQREQVQSLLKALGEELFVAEERYLDMATALNGSGPAYVFLFLEALTDAGVHIGLPWSTAKTIALQTILGSVQMARKTGRHPADLKDQVTSPGGTTTEALLRLEEGGFRATVVRAVLAAYEKSKALGG